MYTLKTENHENQMQNNTNKIILFLICHDRKKSVIMLSMDRKWGSLDIAEACMFTLIPSIPFPYLKLFLKQLEFF